MKKMLWVIGSLDYCNGITNYAINYYNELIKKGYKIDFVVHYDYDSIYKKKIINDGNKVFYMGDYKIKSLLSLKKRIKSLLKSNHYDLIHCHILNLAYFYFSVAKQMNIKVRILHSHATKNSDNFLKNIRNSFFKKVGILYSTHYFACSDLAGKYLFKKNYLIIKNAVDYSKFLFSEDKRKLIMEKHGIPNNLTVLGFVGRFTTQKNIFFILKILRLLEEERFNYFMFIIGDGSQKQDIVNYIHKYNLHAIVIDSTYDISSYYSAIDILLLPSLFEGLPVTSIEAQVAGCKVYCSSTITKELDFTNNCIFLPINDEKKWLMQIKQNVKNDNRFYVPNDYDIKVQACVFDKVLREILHD